MLDHSVFFLSLWPIVSKTYPYSCLTYPPVIDSVIASHHYKQHCDKYHRRYPPLYENIFENCIQRRVLFVIGNVYLTKYYYQVVSRWSAPVYA